MIQVGNHAQWFLFGIRFNSDTIISSIIVSVIILIISLLVKYTLRTDKNISSFQSIIEVCYLFISNIVTEIMGEKGKKFIPFIGTLFIYILFSNIFGILPITEIEELFFGKFLHRIIRLESPTADINVTLGLAIIVFFAIHYYGFRFHGVKYFKRFISPNFLFLPLNMLEEISRPMSLAIRLFGNTFGKATILLVFVSIAALPLFYPIPIMALGIFIAFLQAYIFSLLATMYIYSAVFEENN